MVKGRQTTSQSDSGDYLQTLLAEAEDIVLVIDDGGDIRFANPAAEKVIMAHLDGLTGAHFGVPAMEGKFQFSLLDEPHNMAVMQVGSLGPSKIVSIRTLNKSLTQEAIPVSGQHEAEFQLNDSERLFKNVYDNAINGLGLCDVITDEDGTVIDLIVSYLNPAYGKILRRKAEDALGKSVGDLIDWEEDGSLLARLFKVAQTGEALQFVYHAPVSARHFAVSAYRSTTKQLVIDLKDISAAINAEEA